MASLFAWGLAGASAFMRKIARHSSARAKPKSPLTKMPNANLRRSEAKAQDAETERNTTQVDAAIAAVLARPIVVGERIRARLESSPQLHERRAPHAEACLEVAQLREERAAAEEVKVFAIVKARCDRRSAGCVKRRLPAGRSVADCCLAFARTAKRARHAFGFPLVFAFLIEIVSAFDSQDLLRMQKPPANA